MTEDMGQEQASNNNIYYEVISNRFLMVISLIFITWLSPKYNITGLKLLIYTIVIWAVGDGLIHYRKKILNLFKKVRYG